MRPEKQNKAVVRGTVIDLINDGSNGQPYRALVKAQIHGGPDTDQLVMLESKAPLKAKAGDDVYGSVRQEKPLVQGALPRLVVDGPVPVMNRLAAQAHSGVKIRSFEQEAMMAPGMKVIRPGDPKKPGGKPGAPEAKDGKGPKDGAPKAGGPGGLPPGLVAAMLGGKAAGANLIVNADKGSSDLVIARAETSQDPTMKWVGEMVKEGSKDITSLILHPDLLRFSTPSAEEKKALNMKNPMAMQGAMQKIVAETADRLARHLPVGVDKQSLASVAQVTQMQPGLFMLNLAQIGSTGAIKAGFGIIKPYDPAETSAKMAQNFSGLASPVFMPKKNIPQQFLRDFCAIHEAGHGIQSDYGITRYGQHEADTNEGELFADSFATLATAQRYGSVDHIDAVADMRDSFLINGQSLTHWTGPAIRDARALAAQWIKTGEIKNKSASELAKAAVQIVRKHQMSHEEYDALITRRREILQPEGVRYGMMQNPAGGQPKLVQADQTGGALAVEKVRELLRTHRYEFGKWKEKFVSALGSCERAFYSPKELEDEATAQKAMKLWEEDLQHTISEAGNLDPVVRKIKLTSGQQLSQMAMGPGGQTKVGKRAAHMLKTLQPLKGVEPKAFSEEEYSSMATIIPRKRGKSEMGEMFSQDSKARVDALVSAVRREAILRKRLETAEWTESSSKTLAEMKDIRTERVNLAFAVGADAEAMAMIDKRGNAKLRALVEESCQAMMSGRDRTTSEKLEKTLPKVPTL
ncbi:MAG: hypothetical protein Alpg2KO_18650 [Alphaproteobacteria bacterium]